MLLPLPDNRATLTALFLGALSTTLVAPAHASAEYAADIAKLGTRDDITIPETLRQFPAGPLNMFLRMISTLPQGAAALDASAKILTPLQEVLAKAAGVQTEQNDLAQNAPCADVTVIFARGTTEPGDVGLVTGPPFIDALNEQKGDMSLSFQGVEYPASFAGFNRNGSDGVPSMTKFINQALSDCPDTKVVMSGYSQGALVLRSIAESLPTGTMAKINSVVTFGDPGNPTPIPNADGKFMIICAPDDSVCSGGFINVAHLTYGDNATMAAQFVMERAGGP